MPLKVCNNVSLILLFLTGSIDIRLTFFCGLKDIAL